MLIFAAKLISLSFWVLLFQKATSNKSVLVCLLAMFAALKFITLLCSINPFFSKYDMQMHLRSTMTDSIVTSFCLEAEAFGMLFIRTYSGFDFSFRRVFIYPL
jgi:hypothetical protein